MRRMVDDSRESEVCELETASLERVGGVGAGDDQKMLGLDVAVDDASTVTVPHGLKQLLH